jgi:hypothetical protein
MYMNGHTFVFKDLLLALNGLDIMFTLGVYFEYIRVLCKIFTKYIATILQVYQAYIIYFLK